MKYDFDAITERKGSFSVKYDEMGEVFGREGLIPLWVADMDFATAPPITEALQRRAAMGIYGYTRVPQEYYEAVQGWQKRRNGYEPNLKTMSFAPGVISAIRNYMRAFAKEGDGVIIQEPVYYPFKHIIDALRLRAVVSPLKCEDGYYTMDYEDFERKVSSEKVKFYILCSPHNPVGRVWHREELEKIGNICVRHGVQIIADEIHADLILGDNRHVVMATVSPEISRITTVCTSSSKTFNLAGLQASTIVLPSAEMKEKYDAAIAENETHGGNFFAAAATIAACHEGDEWLEELLKYIEGNLKFINEYLNKEIPALSMRVPEGTYLGWIDASALGMGDDELNAFMVNEAGVAFGRGDSFGFGGSGFLRINTAIQRAVLERALAGVKEALGRRNNK